MTATLPIPSIGNEMFPEAKKWMDEGSHLKLCRNSPDDYNQMDQIWNGPDPDTKKECVVVDGPPDHSGPHVPLAGIGSAFAPDYHPEEFVEIAQKLHKKSRK